MRNTSLSHFLKSKQNSIGFIRLASALLVLVGHSITDGGWGIDPLIKLTNNQIAIGRFPVDIFFVLSGYLITSSYVRSGSLWKYLWHRFLRIFPAYWACILITGLLLPLFFNLSPDWSYVIHNLPLILGIDHTVDGLFINNPGGESVNSSLWTLPWECIAYLLIALFGVLRLLSRKYLMVLALGFTWLGLILTILSNPTIESYTAISSGFRLLTYFFCGVCFFVYSDRISINNSTAFWAFLILICSLLLGIFFFPYAGGLYYILTPLPFAYLVFWLAVKLPFPSINKTNDLSYGIYIYGTLVLNTLAFLKLNDSYVIYISLTLVLTLLLSAISWFIIERPALGFKNLTLHSFNFHTSK